MIFRTVIATDPTEIVAILQWPMSASFTKLEGFFGLAWYYKNFVQNYGIIAKPLTALLQYKVFTWSEQAHQAFDHVKHIMTDFFEKRRK
jgi:hypothetical protein